MSQSGASRAYRPVITLWETYGSGMQSVAQVLSEKLGLPLSQQAFSSEELEQEQQVEKRAANPMLDRVLTLLARQSSNTLQSTSSGVFVTELRDNEEAVKENTATVLRAGDEGGIIMGRSGTVILKDRPNTLHIKLDGRLEDRITRAAEQFGISRDRAAKRQRNEDDVRTRMSIEMYGWNPLENTDFDLVLNTSRMTPEQIVAVVSAALEAKSS